MYLFFLWLLDTCLRPEEKFQTLSNMPMDMNFLGPRLTGEEKAGPTALNKMGIFSRLVKNKCLL